MATHRRQLDEVVEAEHAVRRGPLEQRVQEIAGGERVVEGPMGRPVRKPEAVGERAELAVGDLFAHEAASKRARVDDRVAEQRTRLIAGARR